MSSYRLLRRVAVHEAGHLVVAQHFGLRCAEARVWRDGDGWRGEVTHQPEEFPRHRHVLTVAAAGAVAEAMAYSEPVDKGQDNAYLARLSENDRAWHRGRAEYVLRKLWDRVLDTADVLVNDALYGVGLD